ncbi:terminase large subunit [Mycolicibacterium porcinum]|uniref:terminase large subunit domain-containing protein n=1 Tax=Mycolicibacterium porcinum TaxID=39693 RepID=UPI0031F8DDB9
MKAGPKGQIKAAPLDFSHLPEDRAGRRLAFIAEYLVVPKGVGAGKPVRLRQFQTDIITGAFGPGIRTGLVSVARANGKTGLAAMLAVAELFVGPPSAEVLVVASDQRQANITLRMAKRMIELNPELAERAQIFADRIVVPHNDGLLLPLPAEPGALHGHDPSLLIVDELHVVTEATWEAVTSVSGKRPESLTLAISTPSSSPDCVMWRLVEHGRAGDDPAFYLKEFAAPDGCPTDDRDAWLTANPAMACEEPFLAEDGLEAARRTLREPVFRQLRLGQWVTGAEAWLPWGAWAEAWSKRHGERRVLEWNTAHAARMAPATDRLYQAVVTNVVTHDGDPRMAAHIAHCVAKSTPQGDLVSKDKRGSPRKIDAAVAAIVAYDRAAFHQQRNRKRARSFAS